MDPERDGQRLLAELRSYWKRTGYLPMLDWTPQGIYVGAPDDVAEEWIMAFGMRRS